MNHWLWVQVAIACFPLNAAGGSAAVASASSAHIATEERRQLQALLQKQYSREALAAITALAAIRRTSSCVEVGDKESKNAFEITLGRLIASNVAYCWMDLYVDDWDFIVRQLRVWLEEAVIYVEELTEAVVASVKEGQAVESSRCCSESIVTAAEKVVTKNLNRSVELYSIAVSTFSLLQGLDTLHGASSNETIAKMKEANWKGFELRASEDVLRIFLAIGLAEAEACRSAVGDTAGSVFSVWRNQKIHFLDNVADVALSTSSQARESAIRSVDLWGVGKGAISGLYALVFCCQPTASLQWTAYQFLASDPIQEIAITYGVVVSEDREHNEGKKNDHTDATPAAVAHIRPELASVLEMTLGSLHKSSMTSSTRVNYMLSWALFLTRLQSFPTLSPTWERLVQYAQDSDTTSTLLDFLFQYIPLEQSAGTFGSRKKSLGAGVIVNSAAAPAARAASTGSILFAVEGLCPVHKEGLVTMAGALYGLLLLVLPASVRIWFTSLRDRIMTSSIETFTSTHCSPQLLAAEFAQVQASAVTENFSIRANRTMREVTATYKTEEAAMDIIVRLPACYPLRGVEVDCTRRIGINETLLRKWILSMDSFLRHQNGAVAQALQMWVHNLERQFEGIEECPICFSIIHTSYNSLPRLACSTCRHKFHKECLYKWFRTSHQWTTCPLCKSPF